jgi:hypothetical protein
MGYQHSKQEFIYLNYPPVQYKESPERERFFSDPMHKELAIIQGRLACQSQEILLAKLDSAGREL